MNCHKKAPSGKPYNPNRVPSIAALQLRSFYEAIAAKTPRNVNGKKSRRAIAIARRDRDTIAK
ncbi:MAG: hypothetical protein D6680_17835 [Cyanobacteria bacterium J007]|nr:MAG: hypothetical protein D6680_17835 [Cyanobacteria bacterium J007]